MQHSLNSLLLHFSVDLERLFRSKMKIEGTVRQGGSLLKNELP